VPIVLAGIGVATVMVATFSTFAVVVASGIILCVLSALENEKVLLGSVFLLPFAWVVNSSLPISNVVVPARILLALSFFAGRAWRGQLRGFPAWQSTLSRISILFLGICIATTVFGSMGLTHNSARALALIVSYIAYYFFALEWIDSDYRLQQCVRILLWSTIVVSLFGILQELVGGYTSLWLYLYPPDEAFIDWNWRVPSFLGYSNVLAGYLNLVLPFALACCLIGYGHLRRLACWTVVLGSIGLLLTQSRAGLIAFGIASLLAVLWLIESRRAKVLVVAGMFGMAAMVLVVGSVLSPQHLGSVVSREPMERLLFWATAWRLFVASPVFGIGIGNYGDAYGLYIPSFLIPSRHFTANGLYFQILSEMGLVGMTSFMVFAALVVKQGREHMTKGRSVLSRALGFGALASMIATLFHGIVDLALDVSPQWGTLMWFMLALMCASAACDDPIKDPGGSPTQRCIS
jgi:O-antigen ligase